ncbi:MAG: response regulator transcription factor [Acidobacteria bacterium]|nr:response regulator transcription factor [Acidobacteriota bacterium]
MSGNTAPASPPPSTPIKVVVVEDILDIRESLRIMINGTEGFRCMGAYYSAEEAMEKIGKEVPDVVLMDIGLPKMSGIEATRQLKAHYPKLLILMLTVYDDDERIFNSLCAGACGYLLKKTPPARLLEGIQEAANGGSPMTPEIARRVVELFQQFHPPVQADYQLSAHEVRLLKMLAEGHSYRSAATVLGVTPHAVSFHLRNIYEKLHVHSKSEAVAKALRDHLIE